MSKGHPKGPDAVNVRAEWFLREHGRPPTVDELEAIREHERDEARSARLAR